jgi:uncharacterized protein
MILVPLFYLKFLVGLAAGRAGTSNRRYQSDNAVTWQDNSMNDVVNNKAHHRYELLVDGHLAATYYKLADGVITFIHTEVPPELGGRGVGSRLVKGALDGVRADGLKVIAQCPFVKAYIDKHAEYADLLKG